MENQSQPLPSSEGPAAPAGEGVSTAYAAAVGGLLVLTIACLAYMWFVERSARVRAQALAAQRGATNRAIIDVLNRGQIRAVTPLAPQEVTPQERVVDGQRRRVLMIDEPVARRLGLAAGDVVVVREAGSQPATQPGR
jgi:hypothetical protein